MVGCDLARMALVAGMAVPAGPFWALCTLLVAAELLSAPFGAARAALLPEVLPGRPVRRASAVSNATIQGGQGLGFAAGGGLAAVLGTSAIRSGSPLRSAAAGARLVGSDARLRALVGCAWLGYFFVVPEGLAAPYAAALGGGAGTVGLLMAAQPAGAVVGAVLPARLVAPARRPGLLGPLAVLSYTPRLGGALHPGVVVSLALWAVSGPGTSYQLVANSAFVFAVPAACRGRARRSGSCSRHLRRAGSGHPRRRGRRPVRRARCGGSGGRRRARSRHRHHADVELPGHGGWCVSALATVAPAQRRSAATGRWPSSITEQPPGTRARCAHVW